jgi:small-conductance mechanosensitive channel
MDETLKLLQNIYVLIYLVIIFGGQVLLAWWRGFKRRQIVLRRRAQGLSDDVLLGTSERLVERKREALVESAWLLLTILLVPFVLLQLTENTGQKQGIALAFIVVLVWALVNGTDVAKAFLSGLAFKTLVAFRTPFQIGDRVTLKGIGGKVVKFNTFFVTLQTADDDQISIPTSTLWNEVLSSANGGERSSLCVMNFYLAPFVSASQRQAVEDTIWEAIQASSYFEPGKPMQIYLSQNPDSIQLSARAYVASTYNELLFKSDVTRLVLDVTAKQGFALASAAWKADIDIDVGVDGVRATAAR